MFLQEITCFEANVRRLVLGRPDVDLERSLDEHITRFVQIDSERTSQDIRTFVKDRIQARWPNFPKESQNAVVDCLTEKAGGVFLWARLALDIVCKCRAVKSVFKSIEDLPAAPQSRMQSLYRVIVDRIFERCSSTDDKS